MKACCRTFYEFGTIPKSKGIGMFLSHELLTFGARTNYEEISDLAGQISGPGLVRFLAVLQWLLREDIEEDRAGVALGFLQEFGDPILFRKAEAWLRTGKAKRFLHRSSIPALMQVRMLAPSGGERAAEHGEVADLLMKVNELLEEEDYQAIQAGRTSQGVPIALAASMYRNFFYTHELHWGAVTARHWALLTEGMAAVRQWRPKEAFDVAGIFQGLLGFRPIDMVAITTALTAYYTEFTREQFNEQPQRFLLGVGFLESLGDPNLTVVGELVLGELSASWNEHVCRMHEMARGPRENVQQLFSIYDTPLMREGNAFYPLDFEFLRSQSAEGWYWRLVRRLRDANRSKDIPRLHAAFGRAFEWYCCELVRPLQKDAMDRQIWLDWDGQIAAAEGQKLPDILIKEGETLFMVEVTSAAVPPSVAVSCDPQQLKGALGKTWFGESPKLKQLYEASEGLRAGRVIAPGLDMNRVARIVPILVSLRYVPLHLGLWHWYRDIMREHGLSEEFIDALRIMDSEDWEEFCAGGLEGQSLGVQFSAWQDSPLSWQSFQEWRASVRGERPVHPLVRHYQSALWDEMPEAFRHARSEASG